MKHYKEKLKETDFHNWLKIVLGIHFTKLTILSLVTSVIKDFHSDALTDIFGNDNVEEEKLCSQCLTEKIANPNSKTFKKCSKNVCDQLAQKIRNNHEYSYPSWKNSRAVRWCQCPWEVAKCFMPRDGYLSANTAEETDLNGILSVMINHKAFRKTFPLDVCRKAREVTKMVRHSPAFSVTNDAMKESLDKLVTFLGCCSGEEAKQAVDKIKKMESDTLLISTEDINEVLKNELSDIAKFSMDKISEKRNKCLQQIEEHVRNLKATKSASIEEILSAKSENFEELKKKLKEDLLDFNKSHHNTIIVSPLNEKRDTPLLEFYVKPSIEIQEYQGCGNKIPVNSTPVSSLKDIFNLRNSNEIYLTSKAGFGKTAFCKHLALTWYQAHRNESTMRRHFEEDDINEMKKYDFFFLIILRNADPNHCTIDEMIQDQILHNLARSEHYKGKAFLQEVLTQEKCLVVLDGLDEWSLPKWKRCKSINDIPQRNTRPRCTILTTSRTWKFCKLNLSTMQIDKHVRILELDETSGEQLIKNAFSNLGGNSTEENGEQLNEFYTEMQKRHVQKFKCIPRMLMCLVCLWRDKRSFGRSSCDLFVNILAMLFARFESHSCRYDVSLRSPPQKRKRTCASNCNLNNDVCRKHFDLLQLIGHLAFDKFFNVSNCRENSLVFEMLDAENYIGKSNVEKCLAAGILNQGLLSAEPLSESRTQNRISFAHKTFQQFFAALYVSSLEGQDLHEALNIVSHICNNVNDIFACEDFLIFISGLCPAKVTEFHRSISEVIKNSDIVQNYREDMGSWNFFVGYNQKTKDIQTFQVSCAIECFEHNNDFLDMFIEDFVIDLDFHDSLYSKVLGRAMESNAHMIKSLKIRDVKSKEAFQDLVGLLSAGHSELRKIDLKCEIENSALDKLIKNSPLLSCFVVKGGQWFGNEWRHTPPCLSNATLQKTWELRSLQQLYLRNIKMTHGQLRCLAESISCRSHMRQIGLNFITCLKHNSNCDDVKLDLSAHENLRTIELCSVPLVHVKVNTDNLEICYIGDFLLDGVLPSIMKQLEGAKSLRVFCCGFLKRSEDVTTMLVTIPTFEKLQYVWITNVTLPSSAFESCAYFQNVLNVTFMNTVLKVEALSDLVDNLEHSGQLLRMELSKCSVEPDIEYENLKARIRRSVYFRELQCDDEKNEWSFKADGKSIEND